jgi:8-oxo-dGTP pyrophosphatase MutT (NUDIX family)
MLLYPHEGEGFMPFIQRPAYEGVRNHGGQIALPGGGQEPQDPSRKYTALRETHEEIGVQLSENQVVGELSEIYIPPSDSIVNPFVAIHEERPLFVPDAREVALLHEIPLRTLLDVQNHKVKYETFGTSQEWRIPYYDANGIIIWGATAMMMAEFLEVLEKS